MQSPSSPPSWIAPLQKPAGQRGAGLPGEVSDCPALISHPYPFLLPRPSFTGWGRLTPWLYFSPSLSMPPLLESWVLERLEEKEMQKVLCQ